MMKQAMHLMVVGILLLMAKDAVAPSAWGQAPAIEFKNELFTLSLVIAEDGQSFSADILFTHEITATAEDRRRAVRAAEIDLEHFLSEQGWCMNDFTLSIGRVTASEGIITGQCNS